MQLYVKDYGDGDPLVILHGLLGAGGNWHTLSAKTFGAAYHVLAVDQRNHGRSPHDPVHDYPSMAADLLELLDARGLDRVHLMGHSMGGKTAMYFALHHPERVDKLIVVDIAPRDYEASHRGILDALRALDPADYDSRQAVDDALAEAVPDWGVRQFLLKNLDYGPDGRYRWKMNLDALDANYARINDAVESARTFEGPTCFIRGQRSDYVRDGDLPLIRRLFPNTDVVTIPKAGHWVHAEAPKPFAEVVMGFLE